jgi:predicted enzyme involved in methoxymalonyl-ACP biosynthesis
MNWLIAERDRIEASIEKLSQQNGKDEIAVNDIFFNYSLPEFAKVASLIKTSNRQNPDWFVYLISNGTARHLIDPLTVSLFRRGMNCDVIAYEYDKGVYGAIECEIPSKSIFIIDVGLEYFEQAGHLNPKDSVGIYFDFLDLQLKQIDKHKGSRKVVILPDFNRLALMRPMSTEDRFYFDAEISVNVKNIYDKHNSVTFYAIDEMIRLQGVEIFDDKYWEMAKFSISPNFVGEYSEWMSARVTASVTRKIKCVALDLDNTLWGGVLGDDGYEAVRMSWSNGYSYAKFQTFFKYLKTTGIPLAIVSKNDPKNVDEFFQNRG